VRGLFEQSALAKTALDALKLQHQQQRHHQVIDVAAIGSRRKLLDPFVAPAFATPHVFLRKHAQAVSGLQLFPEK